MIIEAELATRILAGIESSFEEDDIVDFLNDLSGCKNVETVLVEDCDFEKTVDIIDSLTSMFESGGQMVVTAIREGKSVFRLSHYYESIDINFHMYVVASNEDSVSEFLQACLKDYESGTDFKARVPG